ncbi:hypothetical protein quinque_009383 [Culex quinquefasciatus]
MVLFQYNPSNCAHDINLYQNADFEDNYTSPNFLQELKLTVSTDTITFLVLMLHLIFYDHYVPAAIVSKGITLNAAIFEAICLTARAILAVSRFCSVGSGRR